MGVPIPSSIIRVQNPANHRASQGVEEACRAAHASEPLSSKRSHAEDVVNGVVIQSLRPDSGSFM